MRARFLQRLRDFGLTPGQRVLVAVSGGVDSVTLLDLVMEAAAELELDPVVGHVDHGIHPDSAAVAAGVERLATDYGVRALATHLSLGPDASETRARRARHRWLEETRVREGCAWTLTAHHADDQVETVLLRLLQGSGPAGLAGIQAVSGRVLHPLLGFRQDEIRRHAMERGLSWWDDPANRDPRHLRSWLRTTVLPVVRERLPGADSAVLAAASQLEEDRRAWDAVLELLPGLDIRSETDGGSVAVAPFAGYDSAVGPVVLRVWGRRLDCVLSRDHARRVAGFLRQAASGTRMEVGNGWTVEVVFDRAHLRHAAAGEAAGAGAGAETAMLIEGEAGDGELGRWRLFWRHENAPPLQERDALTAWFIPQALLVRPWSEGDRVFPLGGRGRRLVVRCFQDAKVPRQQRKAWPMVTNAAGEIMWVPGVCRSNQMVPPAGVEALRVDAQVV